MNWEEYIRKEDCFERMTRRFGANLWATSEPIFFMCDEEWMRNER